MLHELVPSRAPMRPLRTQAMKERTMDGDERRIVQRRIASILDHPSVYMGGPSPNSMRKADMIIASLESSHRLHATKCGHATWVDYKQHGTHCPTCGMQCHEAEI